MKPFLESDSMTWDQVPSYTHTHKHFTCEAPLMTVNKPSQLHNNIFLLRFTLELHMNHWPITGTDPPTVRVVNDDNTAFRLQWWGSRMHAVPLQHGTWQIHYTIYSATYIIQCYIYQGESWLPGPPPSSPRICPCIRETKICLGHNLLKFKRKHSLAAHLGWTQFIGCTMS